MSSSSSVPRMAVKSANDDVDVDVPSCPPFGPILSSPCPPFEPNLPSPCPPSETSSVTATGTTTNMHTITAYQLTTKKAKQRHTSEVVTALVNVVYHDFAQCAVVALRENIWPINVSVATTTEPNFWISKGKRDRVALILLCLQRTLGCFLRGVSRGMLGHIAQMATKKPASWNGSWGKSQKNGKPWGQSTFLDRGNSADTSKTTQTTQKKTTPKKVREYPLKGAMHFMSEQLGRATGLWNLSESSSSDEDGVPPLESLSEDD